MNQTSKDIKELLLSESSLGISDGADGGNCFISREPPLPNLSITIFDVGGFPDKTLDKKVFEKPIIQIRVRSTSNSGAWEMINSIYNYLNSLGQETINNTLYTFNCTSMPSLLDWDDKDRIRLITTFQILRREIQ